MDLQLSTPALLFPAITLMMLAYTNRFLGLANLIRGLHKKHLENPDQDIIVDQLRNLRRRLMMIKNMQVFGVLSFVLCVFCMFMLYLEYKEMANYTFMASLFALLVSLLISLVEIQISTKALELELSDMEQFKDDPSSLEKLFKRDKKK